jgi:hypothetical protein
MARKVDQVRWDRWRQRMESQLASGLSIAAFCRREGVSQPAFHAWKRRLRGSTSGPRSSREAGTARRSRAQRPTVARRRGADNSLASSTTPTRAAGFLQLPVRGVRSSPWIELTLVDGTLVRVPQENLAAFTTLLRVLRGGDDEALAGEARHA